MSNNVLISLVRFVSRFTVYFYNTIYFSTTFNTPYKRFIKILRFAFTASKHGLMFKSRRLLNPKAWFKHGPDADTFWVRNIQGLTYRPVRPNRWSPVPVYRSGLAGNRSEPVKFKFEFKSRRVIGLDRLTGRLDRFTGQFDRFTGRFDW